MTDDKPMDLLPTSEASPDRPICGFWVRVGAFVLDVILLGVVGFVLGLIFFDQFVQMGEWGRLIGIVIVLGYFGFLNSHIGKGQTLGKKLSKKNMRIHVVGDNGQYISLPRSLLRTIILWIPYFLGLWIPWFTHFFGYFSGHQIISPNSMSPMGLFVSSVAIGLGVGLIYFYLFNRRSRQSLHDLISNTYVVRDTATGEISVGPMARVHYIVFSALVAVLVAFIVVHRIAKHESYSDVLIVQRNLNQVEEVLRLVYVDIGNESIVVHVRWKDKPVSFDAAIDEVAKVVLDSYPDIQLKDEMGILVNYGYDIGIPFTFTSSSQGTLKTYSPTEWRKRLEGG